MIVSLAPDEYDDDEVFFDFLKGFFSASFPDDDDDAFGSGPSDTLSAENFDSDGSM